MNVRLQFGFASLAVVLFQSVIKVYGVLLTGSLSFLSETVDTLVDIAFVALTIYSIIQSQKPPDYEHMYGHQKIESVGTLLQGIILINLYGLIIYTSTRAILTQSFQVSNPEIGTTLLILSFVVNLVFSRILVWQGRKRKSTAIEMQGLNLFGDSIRAIFVLVSFILALSGITVTDPFFSLGLSIWIIASAIGLAKDGVKELVDTNPIDPGTIATIQAVILDVEHVFAVNNVRIRQTGQELFFEIEVVVEDHISVIHAQEVKTAIRSIGHKYLGAYEVNYQISMYPRAGESDFAEGIHNLLDSMISEYEGVIRFRNVEILELEGDIILSFSIRVDGSMTLEKAHDLTSNIEKDIKEREPRITRTISHIESGRLDRPTKPQEVISACSTAEERIALEDRLVHILQATAEVKGYHGFECWATGDSLVIELHVFFDGNLNIAEVHSTLSRLERKIKRTLGIGNLEDVLLHPEPVSGRSGGHLFD